MRSVGNQKGRLTALAVGLLGGLVATVAMSRFQVAWKKYLGCTSGTLPSSPSAEPTDVEACRKIIRRLGAIAGVQISQATIQTYALPMHYFVGAGAGALYGIAGMIEPGSRSKFRTMLLGAGLGTGMFVAADKIATPMLGLESGSLMGSPAYGISSHIVFGVLLAQTCDQSRALYESARSPTSVEQVLIRIFL
jgi:hypothetical protein